MGNVCSNPPPSDEPLVLHEICSTDARRRWWRTSFLAKPERVPEPDLAQILLRYQEAEEDEGGAYQRTSFPTQAYIKRGAIATSYDFIATHIRWRIVESLKELDRQVAVLTAASILSYQAAEAQYKSTGEVVLRDFYHYYIHVTTMRYLEPERLAIVAMLDQIDHNTRTKYERDLHHAEEFARMAAAFNREHMAKSEEENIDAAIADYLAASPEMRRDIILEQYNRIIVLGKDEPYLAEQNYAEPYELRADC